MNTRSLILAVLLLMIFTGLDAQRWKLRRYEAAFGLGTVSYFGDYGGTTSPSLQGVKDFQLNYTRPSFNLGLRYKVAGNMAVKANLVYGFIAGSDQDSRNEGRNIGFRSTIFEPSIQFEYYLLSDGTNRKTSGIFNKRGMLNNYADIHLYLFGGIGGVLSNPKPLKDFDLIIRDDQKFGLVFPLGIGLKYSIDTKWSIGAEFGPRFTLTDGIDGYVSDFSEYNDFYYFTSINAIYKLRSDRRGLPILRGSRTYR